LAQIGHKWIDQPFAWLAGTIDRRFQATGDASANGLAIHAELAGDRRDRQSLSMKIKNHDDFPKLDHRSAPSFWVERDWVIDSPPIPRARPGDGGTINWGIFKRHFWGELLRHQQHTVGRTPPLAAAMSRAAGKMGAVHFRWWCHGRGLRTVSRGSVPREADPHPPTPASRQQP